MQKSHDRAEHWQRVHTNNQPGEVSWFQSDPVLSRELIERYCVDKGARVIDVGGGISCLVDRLLEQGWQQLTVLDVSAKSLAHSQARLGRDAERVQWIVGDVLDAPIERGFALWHDRAVFHFLTDLDDRKRYASRLHETILPGGHAIVATFAEDGPKKCSGLDVVRYSTEALHAVLGEDRFSLEHAQREVHRTPGGQEQRFQFGVFRRI